MPYKYTLTRDFLQRHDYDLLQIVRLELISPGCIHPLVQVVDDMHLQHGYIFFAYQLLPVGPGIPHIFEVVASRSPSI